MSCRLCGIRLQPASRTIPWKAIYASTDAEFDQIVADMISQANEYGYDQCVEFQENEAKLRAAAEDAVK